MDTPENLVETPRDEMADSRGPDGEFLYPELRQATAAGDVVTDPEYMKPSLAGEPGLDQPDASSNAHTGDDASGAADPLPLPGETGAPSSPPVDGGAPDPAEAAAS